MKKKILIPIIVIILLILAIIGLYAVNSTRDVQVHKGNIPVLISNEENDKIMEFYNNTNKGTIPTEAMVDLAIVGEIVLKFNDGNMLSLDENSISYAYLNNEEGEGHLIQISSEFHDYIFSII